MPAPAAPIETPPALSFEDHDEAVFEQHRAQAMACMRWLLDTHPAAEPDTWTRVRDFALDWIEGAPGLDPIPRSPALARVEQDRRFVYSMYMRGAYEAAHTLHRLEHAHAQPLEHELGGIAGMQRLYAVFRAADPRARSRALDKLRRLEARGKLPAWLDKQRTRAAVSHR